jgi:predicted TIM-barrel fold metal-dependent hydrolase
VESVNNFVASAVKAHPESLAGFGALHKDMADPAAEIARIMRLGLKGVKLHPDFQGFDMDDEGMLETYGMLEGVLPVMMHCGDYRSERSHPARLARILKLFPKLVVIAAHFGGWSLFDLALEHLQGENCLLDVSSSIMFLGDKRSAELVRAYGAERILFGSDYPMWSPDVELERFNRLKLSNEERQMILSENAKRVLGE